MRVDATVRRTTAELSQVRCIVMLGLPGMGKTTEMKRLARAAEDGGAYSDFVSLGRVATRAELERQLQESAGRQAWANGREWAIHLDGLDESVIEHDDLIAAIDYSLRLVLADLTSVSMVEKDDRLQRLKVRISCRAAEWPDNLSTKLRSLFGDGVEVVQLEELEAQDAESAARASGIASSTWQEIVEKLDSAEALTRRPITLRLLLNIYEHSQDIPAGQVPLYHSGILALLEEANELRRRNGLIGRLDTVSRLLVAARIAAATTFSGSTSVGISAGSADADTALVAEIAGGVEASAREGFRVGEPEIIELLRTALFVPLNDTKFTWAHRTFSEFLAAYYLAERGLSTAQLLEFLSSAQDPAKRIPPQLQEVASWVASMRQDFFRALVSRQPIILLSSDVAAASNTDRSNLVRQLLQDFDDELIFDTDWNLRRRFSKLDHPGLREDLLPYLSEKDHSSAARRIAIQIAIECNEKSLAGDLLSIALDRSEEIYLRVQAVIAVGELGAAEVRSKLKPLAIPGDPADEDDELRGWALAALWPGLINFAELLEALTPRKRSNLIGGYWRFQHYLELTLSPEESVSAVQWVREQAAQEDDDDFVSRKLFATMLVAAWQNAADSRVIEAFAGFCAAANTAEAIQFVQSSEFGQFAAAFRNGNAAHRRRLAEIVFKRQGEEGRPAHLSIYSQWPLFIPDDIPWLLQQLSANDRSIQAETLVAVIVALVHVDGIEDHDDVWQAAETNRELAAALIAQFSTDLESSLAQFNRRRQQEAANQDQPAFDLLGEAEKRLARSQAHVEEWWEFNLLFFVNERGRWRRDELASDLTDQPLWRLLSPEQRQGTMDWAEAYLVNDKSPQRNWLGTSTFHRPAAAAYRAFRLLLSRALDRFEALGSDIWGRWAHAILATGANEDEVGRRIRLDLVVRAYQTAPRHFIAALLRVLIRATTENSLSRTLDRLELAYDEHIATLLWRVALRDKTPSVTRLDLLRFLVSRNHPTIRRAIVGAMSGDHTDQLPVLDEGAIVSLAGEFLIRFPTEAWPYLARLATSDLQRARAIFLEAHSSHAMGSFAIAGFTAAELRDLYLWIDANFPPPPEDRDGGGRLVGPTDRVQVTRRATLDRLVQLGTSASVDAVRDLATHLPGQSWLKSRLADAEAAFQLQAWRSRSAGNVLRTIASYSVTPPVRSVKDELKTAASELLADDGQAGPAIDLTTPAIDVSPAPVQPVEALSILSVATEWSSAHGGLSTLNRDLCIALAQEGHLVSCLVIDASDQELADADSHSIRLLTCPADPGVSGSDRLLLVSPEALVATGAGFVVGHDHITGHASHHIAKRILKAPNVHVVHTIPDEIEAHKSVDLYQNLAKGADKTEVQLRQCRQADLVIAVGPRIYREIADKLGTSPPVAQLRPGLAKSQPRAKHPVKTTLLFQGRLEHAMLKGAKLAFDATMSLRSNFALSPWEKPDLIMRGFEKDKLEQQCSGIINEEGLKTFVRPRFFTTDEVSLEADLNAASLLLMPSKREGFGLVALEAIAAGVPILITAESGLAEMLHRDPEVVAAIDPISAQLSVCSVDGTSDAAVTAEWAKQMKAILDDRAAAFARADRFRKDLSSALSWQAAARSLVDQLKKL